VPRHTLWRNMVANGKSYELQLSVPESQFQESKPIFEEMVRSFKLATA